MNEHEEFCEHCEKWNKANPERMVHAFHLPSDACPIVVPKKTIKKVPDKNNTFQKLLKEFQLHKDNTKKDS